MDSDLVSPKNILICVGGVFTIGIAGSYLSPSNAVQIFGFCGVVIAQLITILQSRRNAVKVEATAAKAEVAATKAAVKVEEAAVKVEEVKKVLGLTSEDTSVKLGGLATTLEDVKLTGEKNHELVNSRYGAELRISMMALKRIADRDGNKDDVAAYQEAERYWKEHEAKQAKADTIR